MISCEQNECLNGWHHSPSDSAYWPTYRRGPSIGARGHVPPKALGGGHWGGGHRRWGACKYLFTFWLNFFFKLQNFLNFLKIFPNFLKFSRNFLKFSKIFLKFSKSFFKFSKSFLKFSHTFLKLSQVYRFSSSFNTF